MRFCVECNAWVMCLPIEYMVSMILGCKSECFCCYNYEWVLD